MLIGCRSGGHGGVGACADNAVKLQPPIIHLRRPTFRAGRVRRLLQLGVAPTTPSIMNSSDHQPNSSDITTGHRATTADRAVPSIGTLHLAVVACSRAVLRLGGAAGSCDLSNVNMAGTTACVNTGGGSKP